MQNKYVELLNIYETYPAEGDFHRLLYNLIAAGKLIIFLDVVHKDHSLEDILFIIDDLIRDDLTHDDPIKQEWAGKYSYQIIPLISEMMAK